MQLSRAEGSRLNRIGFIPHPSSLILSAPPPLPRSAESPRGAFPRARSSPSDLLTDGNPDICIRRSSAIGMSVFGMGGNRYGEQKDRWAQIRPGVSQERPSIGLFEDHGRDQQPASFPARRRCRAREDRPKRAALPIRRRAPEAIQTGQPVTTVRGTWPGRRGFRRRLTAGNLRAPFLRGSGRSPSKSKSSISSPSVARSR